MGIAGGALGGQHAAAPVSAPLEAVRHPQRAAYRGGGDDVVPDHLVLNSEDLPGRASYGLASGYMQLPVVQLPRPP